MKIVYLLLPIIEGLVTTSFLTPAEVNSYSELMFVIMDQPPSEQRTCSMRIDFPEHSFCSESLALSRNSVFQISDLNCENRRYTGIITNCNLTSGSLILENVYTAKYDKPYEGDFSLWYQDTKILDYHFKLYLKAPRFEAIISSETKTTLTPCSIELKYTSKGLYFEGAKLHITLPHLHEAEPVYSRFTNSTAFRVKSGLKSSGWMAVSGDELIIDASGQEQEEIELSIDGVLSSYSTRIQEGFRVAVRYLDYVLEMSDELAIQFPEAKNAGVSLEYMPAMNQVTNITFRMEVEHFLKEGTRMAVQFPEEVDIGNLKVEGSGLPESTEVEQRRSSLGFRFGEFVARREVRFTLVGLRNGESDRWVEVGVWLAEWGVLEERVGMAIARNRIEALSVVAKVGVYRRRANYSFRVECAFPMEEYQYLRVGIPGRLREGEVALGREGLSKYAGMTEHGRHVEVYLMEAGARVLEFELGEFRNHEDNQEGFEVALMSRGSVVATALSGVVDYREGELVVKSIASSGWLRVEVETSVRVLPQDQLALAFSSLVHLHPGIACFVGTSRANCTVESNAVLIHDLHSLDTLELSLLLRPFPSPATTEPIPDFLSLRHLSSSGCLLSQSKLVPYSFPTPAPLKLFQVRSLNPRYGEVSTYEFTIECAVPIPKGSLVTLSMPPELDIARASMQQDDFRVGANPSRVEFRLRQGIEPDSAATLVVARVRNPSQAVQGFAIEVHAMVRDTNMELITFLKKEYARIQATLAPLDPYNNTRLRVEVATTSQDQRVLVSMPDYLGHTGMVHTLKGNGSYHIEVPVRVTHQAMLVRIESHTEFGQVDLAQLLNAATTMACPEQHCVQCSQVGCLRCSEGHKIHHYGCVEHCPPGSVDRQGVCHNCRTNHCLICSPQDLGWCIQCKVGHPVHGRCSLNQDKDQDQDHDQQDDSIEDNKIQDTPIEDGPIEETPIEDTIQDTPIEDTPIEDNIQDTATPTQDTPNTPNTNTPTTPSTRFKMHHFLLLLFLLALILSATTLKVLRHPTPSHVLLFTQALLDPFLSMANVVLFLIYGSTDLFYFSLAYATLSLSQVVHAQLVLKCESSGLMRLMVLCYDWKAILLSGWPCRCAKELMRGKAVVLQPLLVTISVAYLASGAESLYGQGGD